LRKVFRVRRNTAVDTENLIVDDRDERHPLKNSVECVVESSRLVLRGDLGSESVGQIHRLELVVPTQEEDMRWICNEHRKEQGDNLDRVFAAVNVITEEEEAGPRRAPGMDQDTEKIKDIPVDVADNVKRSVEIQNNVRVLESSARPLTELGNEIFVEYRDGNRSANVIAVGAVEVEQRAKPLENN
jgi:hypothetical protein